MEQELKLTGGQIEVLRCLIDFEIESDTDYLNDVSGEEFVVWETHIRELKEIRKEIE